jgi:hypothetical protein
LTAAASRPRQAKGNGESGAFSGFSNGVPDARLAEPNALTGVAQAA